MHTVARDRIDPGTRIVSLKWVYKIKACERYKSRLVALGNLMDDNKMDTEPPTPSMTVVCTLFSLAAKRGWDVQLIDVDTAFLNAAPNNTVYVSLPQGFVSFCFVLFGLQLSVCLWWLQVPLRDLSDA